MGCRDAAPLTSRARLTGVTAGYCSYSGGVGVGELYGDGWLVVVVEFSVLCLVGRERGWKSVLCRLRGGTGIQ